MRNGRYILVVGVLLAALLAADALGASGYRAHAVRPSYDRSSLQLVGSGTYRSDAKRKLLKINVCLRKRVGKRFFDVRCATAEGSGRRVGAEVAVPGCVKGVWRTVVSGEAFDRNGSLLDTSSAASRPFRCT